MRQRSLEDAVFVVVWIIRFISGVAVCSVVNASQQQVKPFTIILVYFSNFLFLFSFHVRKKKTI